MPLVGATEAGQGMAAQTSALNSSRYVPQMDPMVKAVSDAHRLYIFNVGPWSHMRMMPGAYFIPACPPDKDYSEPLVINGIENETYPINETECAVLPKSGRPGQLRGDGSGELFALQILGEGVMLPPSASLRPFGVFISKTPEPSKEAVQQARLLLRQKRQEIIAEADEFYVIDRANCHKYIQKDWHHRAALDEGKTKEECPWLGAEILPAERKKCASCGTPYEVGIAECPKCGDVLDEDKYAEKLARLERVRGGKKKRD